MEKELAAALARSLSNPSEEGTVAAIFWLVAALLVWVTLRIEESLGADD